MCGNFAIGSPAADLRGTNLARSIDVCPTMGRKTSGHEPQAALRGRSSPLLLMASEGDDDLADVLAGLHASHRFVELRVRVDAIDGRLDPVFQHERFHGLELRARPDRAADRTRRLLE